MTRHREPLPDSATLRTMLLDEVIELRGRLGDAMELLRRLEWSGGDSGYPCCPVCRVDHEHHPVLHRPHADGCAMAAILARGAP